MKENNISINASPQVSIGMPVFNGERYIRESLDSLLNQNFTDFELIISDNASTDETQNICEEYASSDSRIKYIRQEKNIGAEANFEYVLEKSNGEYFMWAAHDDLWDANWIKALLAAIKPSDIGVRGRIIFIDENGSFVFERDVCAYKKNSYIKVFLDDERKSKNFYIYSLFYTEKLKRVRFESLYRDYYPDFLFPLALVAQGDLRKIQDTKQYYRVHDANLGVKYNAKWLDWRRLAYRAHPLRYYTYAINEVPDIYKIAIFFISPIKHIKSQLIIWFRGMYFIFTGKKIS